MSESISISEAKEIMKERFIGPAELKSMTPAFLEIPESIPVIPFSFKTLKEKANDYVMILGCSRMANGNDTTIRNIRSIFGMDPDVFEPCFYNQDWYENEDFIDIPMGNEWFLIRKDVYESSRAIRPEVLETEYSFPSAIKCTYAFFVVWYVSNYKLWYHDFVWCNDTDHNGDRIYVGKYNDVDGINKNGFSIHRHLSLRPCYACID